MASCKDNNKIVLRVHEYPIDMQFSIPCKLIALVSLALVHYWYTLGIGIHFMVSRAIFKMIPVYVKKVPVHAVHTTNSHTTNFQLSVL